MNRNIYPIENQVCAIEQAKELAELLGDCAPESYFAWVCVSWINKTWEIREWWLAREDGFDKSDGASVFNAYTGDELGALLPVEIEYDGKTLFRQSYPFANKGFCDGYVCCDVVGIDDMLLESASESIKPLSESQSKAALAIKGLREGWIKKDDFIYRKI